MKFLFLVAATTCLAKADDNVGFGVVGGDSNTAFGISSLVAGGRTNIAAQEYTSVAGGNKNWVRALVVLCCYTSRPVAFFGA